MPRVGGRYRVLVKGAEKAMESFKLEVAKDLGLAEKIDADGTYKEMTTVEVGQIGGEMVKRIQAAGEYAILQRYQKNEQRLMPVDILPDEKFIRQVSNNGNPRPTQTKNVSHTPGSGQQFGPQTIDANNSLQ